MNFYAGIFLNVKKLMKPKKGETNNEDINKKNIFTIL